MKHARVVFYILCPTFFNIEMPMPMPMPDNTITISQVGAQTETELKEKKLRVEDALNATKVFTYL